MELKQYYHKITFSVYYMVSLSLIISYAQNLGSRPRPICTTVVQFFKFHPTKSQNIFYIYYFNYCVHF